MSLNDVVVHGIPNDYILNDGDIISIDCGVYLNELRGLWDMKGDFMGGAYVNFMMEEGQERIHKT